MAAPLEQSIFATLTYFDVVRFPLTAEEIFTWLWQPPKTDRALLETKLAELVQQGRIGFQFGLYFLAGSEKNVESRRAAVVLSDQKINHAIRAAKKLRWIPFLRAICLCNSVATETATENSDIDFFIIAEKNRLWIVRFFTNLTLRFFGLRTFGDKQKDRICLSFYLDTNHLNIAPWRVVPDDIHLAYWLSRMLPIFDPNGWYAAFVKENDWIKKFLPNLIVTTNIVSSKRVNRTRLSRTPQTIGEAFWRGSYGDLIEKQAKELQWLRIPLSVKEKSKEQNGGVVITDGVIKLHEHDTRKNIYEEWRERQKIFNL